MTPKRQAEIEGTIDQLQLSIDKTYPKDSLIDIVKASIPEISIVEHDFHGDRNTRGVIYKKSDNFKTPLIVIQKKLTKEGKTFALAHEFAHYVLGHTGSANFMFDKIGFDGSESAQKEAEAEFFAASLLMPRDEFTKLAELLDIKGLAKRFGVSESAARVRKRWLDGAQRERTL